MVAASFDYHAPSSVEDAVELLNENRNDAKVLAGGHSLIPLMKLRLSEPKMVIDLGKISSLSYIREQNGGLAIGAMTTYSEIANSAAVQAAAPALSDAAGQVADPQVRNMGTIGGSLSHADPAGDIPAVILALNAVMVASSEGRVRGVSTREIAADDFFVDLFTTALRDNEILTEIRIPALGNGTGTAYAKMANKASHFAIVGVAASVTVDSSGKCTTSRIAVTGAGPKASRAIEAEEILEGNAVNDTTITSAARMASYGIEFNEDVHASAEYREHLTQVFAERAIRAAADRAG